MTVGQPENSRHARSTLEKSRRPPRDRGLDCGKVVARAEQASHVVRESTSCIITVTLDCFSNLRRFLGAKCQGNGDVKLLFHFVPYIRSPASPNPGTM
jgi:hypothetical protein